LARDTKERILRASVRTLSLAGYRKSTARAIAATGGFAPGVIYYHFADLDDLFVATVRFTSEQRLARYQAETAGVTSAVEMVERLRALYAEDEAEGHIAAMQELVAAAVGSERLAEPVREETVRFVDYAETVLHQLIDGTPFASMIPVPEVAAAAVATYLGLEMLSHLRADRTRPEQMFDAAARLAAIIDAVHN
jgi:AcrR family transcriptional regulator